MPFDVNEPYCCPAMPLDTDFELLRGYVRFDVPGHGRIYCRPTSGREAWGWLKGRPTFDLVNFDPAGQE